MSLSREERRALDDLERQLTGDPEIDIALSSLPNGEESRHWWQRRALGWVAIAIGAVGTIGLLAVSVAISFVTFLILLVGVAIVVGRDPITSVRRLLTETRDFGRRDADPNP